MGKTFENLTWDDLCDLMCGAPEEEAEEDEDGEYRSETIHKST